jgi:hypothetical protein
VHDDFTELLRRQHGVATTQQASAAGVPSRQQRTLVRSGVLLKPAPELLVLSGATRSWRQRAVIATLGSHPLAALSHGSAARLLALDGFDRFSEMHVTVPHGHRASIGRVDVTVHQTRRWEPDDVIEREAIKVRTLPLTLIDVFAVHGRTPTSRALDSALRLGTSIEDIQQVAADRIARGRPGPRQLLVLLDEKTDKRLPRSWFQRLAAQAINRFGWDFEDELPVHDHDGRLLAELDLALPQFKVGVECQSWRWHSTPTARAWDALRKRLLRRLGWELVEVWWADLRRMDDVMATIAVAVHDRQLLATLLARPHLDT